MISRISCLFCLVALLMAGTTASADLVGHYRLDESAGTLVTDDSGNAFDGELTGDATWVEGYIAGAIQMDGGDAVVLPAENMGMTSEVGSVAFWLNMPADTVVGINTIWWGGDNDTGGGFGADYGFPGKVIRIDDTSYGVLLVNGRSTRKSNTIFSDNRICCWRKAGTAEIRDTQR